MRDTHPRHSMIQQLLSGSLRNAALLFGGALCAVLLFAQNGAAISPAIDATAANNPQEADVESQSTVKSFFPYLVFPGTCREAVEFYAQSLDAKVNDLQTYGDSPVEVPADQRDRIFNAELRFGDHVFMACDDLPGNAITMGNNISMFLVFKTKAEKVSAFEKLAEEGKVLFPAEEKFGMLEDKYGVRWMLMHEED